MMDIQSTKPPADNQQGSDAKTGGAKKPFDWKLATLVFAVLEILSYVLWQETEDFKAKGFTAVLLHWTSKSGALAGAAFLVHKFSKKPMPVWITFGILSFVMLVIPIARLLNSDHLFSVHVRTGITIPPGSDQHAGLYWFARGTVISPIDVMLFVYFTNEKDVPCMIDGYSVECQSTNGTWKKMWSIDPRQGILFMGTDLHHAGEFELLEDSFSAAAQNKDIPPHGTIQGWLLLVAPNEKYTGKMRLRIRDTTDAESTQAIGDFGSGSGASFSVQDAGFRLKEIDKDISGLKMYIPEAK